MKKVCVILGAGASYDVQGAGSQVIRANMIEGDFTNAWQPPLASELFNIGQRPRFEKILLRYPGARTLAQLLAVDTQSEDISLESELRRYAIHHDEQTRQNFKHIPPYIRDVIWACNSFYVETPSNYSRLVQNVLAEEPHDVLFLTLNYDTLLEKAISLYNPRISFGNLSGYVDTSNVKVVKLHGSINWFRAIAEPGDWFKAVEDFDPLSKPQAGNIMINNDTDVSSLQFRSRLCYPVLTAPLAGKDPSAMVAPDRHVEVARNFISDCQKFLIIGCSALDNDLLEMLDETVTGASQVLLVAGLKQADAAAKRFMLGVTGFRNAVEQGRIALSDVGFSVFLGTNDFRDFIKS